MNEPEKTFWSGKLADYGAWGIMVGVLLWGARVYLVPLIEQQQQALAVQTVEFPKQTRSLLAIETSNNGILAQVKANGARLEDGLDVAPSDVLEKMTALLQVQPAEVLVETKEVLVEVRDLGAKIDKLIETIEGDK